MGSLINRVLVFLLVFFFFFSFQHFESGSLLASTLLDEEPADILIVILAPFVTVQFTVFMKKLITK